MNNIPSENAFFLREVAQRSEALNAAGIGLEGIGLMLAESELSSSEMNALHHAVIALGAMVNWAGSDLYCAAKKLEGSE